jgi:hypothetical protein
LIWELTNSIFCQTKNVKPLELLLQKWLELWAGYAVPFPFHWPLDLFPLEACLDQQHITCACSSIYVNRD